MSLEEKLDKFFVDLLSGNFKVSGTTKLGRFYKSGRNMITAITKGCIMDIAESDFIFDTHFYMDLKKYIAKTYLTPTLLSKKTTPDQIFERNFATHCNREWRRLEDVMRSQKITIATAAITVKYLKNKVLAVTKDGRLAFVNDENYQMRFINDSDGSTVFFGSERDWIAFAYPAHPEKEWFIDATHSYPELKSLVNDFVV